MIKKKLKAEKKAKIGKKKVIKRGHRPKGPKKCPYVVYITETLKNKIKADAKKHGMYLTDYAEALLSKKLHRN